MMQKLVVSTLATLNTVLSPLAPGVGPGAMVTAMDLRSQCSSRAPAAMTQAPVSASVRIERVADTYFALRIEGSLCSGNKAAAGSTVVHLPSQLLDSGRIERLPVGFGFVVPFIPSAQSETRKDRVKFTKLADEGSMIPVRVEWLPQDNTVLAPPALMIWMKRNASGTDFVWTRLEFLQALPGNKSIAIRGELTPSAVL